MPFYLLTGSRCKFTKNDNKGYGYPKFLLRDNLFNAATGLLSNDRLTVHCEVIDLILFYIIF